MTPQMQFICDYIFENEGGYSNIPEDSGGPTNYGITQEDLKNWRKRPVTADDVKNMTKDEASQILVEFYLKPMNIDKITAQAIACSIADTGLLYGPGTAVRYAQRVARMSPTSFNLTVDGNLGPVSQEAINKLDPKMFVPNYRQLILDRIDDIIAGNPSQEMFRKGWTERANRLLTLI